MPNTVLGKVSVVPRGDYSASTTYYALDIVGYNGGSYLAMQEVTGVIPSNDGVNWMQLSGPGLPGENGTNGVTFTPSVSEAGVISWTNDGGEDNPDPVNIMGPQGNPGAAAGFGEATATVDETTGTPSVEVETSGPDTAKVFSFSFSGLKGETGAKGDTGGQGIQGIPGVAAGFGTPTATVDDNVGTPGVTVQASGPDTAKVFSFAFTNLKGETGAQGIQGIQGPAGTSVASISRTSGTGAAGTTDTYTMYDSDGGTIGTFTVYNGSNGTGSGDFMANGTVPMTGALDMGGNRVTNVGAPTAGTDAVRQSDLQAVSDEVDHILDGTTQVAIPAATEAKVGGIKPGTGLEVEADGTANVTLTGVPSGGTTGQILTQGASGPVWQDAPDTGVTTFNGRTGEVEPQEGDYTASMVGAIPASEKGASSGVATLDSNGKLAEAQKPTYTASEVGARPSTWTPSAEDVGAIPEPEGGETGQVLTRTSTGAQWDDVPSDLPAGGTDGQILTKTTDGVAWENPPDTGVISFNGRKGEVSPGADDYSASMIKFTDGQTFQQKYDSGQLTGPAGANGSNGQDGSPGADGEDGGYYQPSVDGSGNLNWTASKPGMPAVSGSNIKGATGPAGTNGKDATINGVNSLTLEATEGLSGSQIGEKYTISGKNLKPLARTITLASTGWSNNTQTVAVDGVLADETKQLVHPVPSALSQTSYIESGVLCTSQSENSLTFKCEKVPSGNLTVYVSIQEVRAS